MSYSIHSWVIIVTAGLGVAADLLGIVVAIKKREVRKTVVLVVIGFGLGVACFSAYSLRANRTHLVAYYPGYQNDFYPIKMASYLPVPARRYNDLTAMMEKYGDRIDVFALTSGTYARLLLDPEKNNLSQFDCFLSRTELDTSGRTYKPVLVLNEACNAEFGDVFGALDGAAGDAKRFEVLKQFVTSENGRLRFAARFVGVDEDSASGFLVPLHALDVRGQTVHCSGRHKSSLRLLRQCQCVIAASNEDELQRNADILKGIPTRTIAVPVPAQTPGGNADVVAMGGIPRSPFCVHKTPLFGDNRQYIKEALGIEELVPIDGRAQDEYRTFYSGLKRELLERTNSCDYQ